MSAYTIFREWLTNFYLLDWIALTVFLAGLTGYRFFLALMLRHRPDNLFLGKLQQYRHAWIEAHSGGQNSIMVVQTLRNTIMSASFLASTSVIMIMGAFSLLLTLSPAKTGGETFYLSGASGPEASAFKILLIIIILSYSFFNFTWHIREINYMSFIINIPKNELDKIEGGDSTQNIAKMFLTSGIHFSLGLRGYYFLIPLLMWFFSPALMIAASLAIIYILMRRDLAGFR